MIYISDETLDRYIKEDVPYIDLTTVTLGMSGKKGLMRFECRDEAVICGTEEVLRILGKFHITSLHHLPSGSSVQPNTVILEAEGCAENLHMAWKVSQNILEYASGTATRTARILARAREANPGIQLLSTRKVFPGTKELSIKAVLAGGGMPHRLGLSESVLVFEQHWAFVGGFDELTGSLGTLKAKNPEKKIIIEVTSEDEAVRACQAGAHGVQFDKIPHLALPQAVERLKGINPDLVILAAGGINEDNASAYAATGVDALVTTAVYFGKPTNIGVKISPL